MHLKMCVPNCTLETHRTVISIAYTKKKFIPGKKHCHTNVTNHRISVFFEQSPNKDKHVHMQGNMREINGPCVEFMTCLLSDKIACLQHLDGSKSLTAWNV